MKHNLKVVLGVTAVTAGQTLQSSTSSVFGGNAGDGVTFTVFEARYH